MFIAYAVIAILLTVALLPSARLKLIRDKRIVALFTDRLGVPLGLYPFLAACEIAGAAGLIIGLWWGPRGIAAATGIVLYFIGAIGAHLRKGDVKGIVTPVLALSPRRRRPDPANRVPLAIFGRRVLHDSVKFHAARGSRARSA